LNSGNALEKTEKNALPVRFCRKKIVGLLAVLVGQKQNVILVSAGNVPGFRK